MNRRSINRSHQRFAFTALLTLMLYIPLNVSAAQMTPENVIQERYQAILDLIESKQLVADMSEDELYKLMEKELQPAIDFTRIARKVMAKFSRQASDTQLEAFTTVFKQTLVNTYAKGLENIDKLDKVEIIDSAIDKRGVRAKVATTVHVTTGEVYRVDYSLFLNDAKDWKVENIVVEGVNIGITFRNQFASYMEQYGDIDAVIQNWGNKVN